MMPVQQGNHQVMTQTHTAGVDAAHVAERIAHDLRRSNTTVATAESVTGGNIATHLAAAQGAGDWFRGALTAYSEEAKFAVLNVKPGPVITADCARQMAIGVAQLLKADFAVGTTGAGGPGPEEINPRARSSSPSPLPPAVRSPNTTSRAAPRPLCMNPQSKRCTTSPPSPG
jgi:nicotinamide-nucleotide amidase